MRIEVTASTHRTASTDREPASDGPDQLSTWANRRLVSASVEAEQVAQVTQSDRARRPAKMGRSA